MRSDYQLFADEPQRFVKCFARVVVCLALATLLRLLFHPYIGEDRPLATFLFGGILVGWLCGFWSAIFSLVSGFVISLAFFGPAGLDDHMSTSQFATEVAHYFILGTLAAVLTEVLHRSRKRLEDKAAQLDRNRQWLSTILRNIADSVFVVDSGGKITFANQSAENFASIAGNEVEGLPFDEVLRIYEENDPETPVSILTEVLENRKTILHRNHRVARFASGLEIPIAISGAPVSDDSGNIISAVLVLHDVSERKKVEERLRESEIRFRRLAEASTEGVVILSGEVIQEANERLAQIFGYKLHSIVGKPVTNFFVSDSQAVISRNIRNRFDQPYEATGLRKDGSRIYLELTGKNTFFDGKPGRVTTIRDITERKAAERAARTAEARLQLITDAVPVLISYVSKDGRYQLVNKEYERWFKHTRAEIEGKHMSEVLGEAAWGKVKPYVDQALAGSVAHFEDHVNYRDAGPRWVSITYVPDRNDRGEVQGFIVLVADLSERKEAEEAVQAWRDRYETVVSASGMILYDVDAAAERVILGGSLTHITGYKVEELEGRVEKWIELVHPDDRARFVQEIHDSRVSGRVDLEYRIRRTDGTYIYVHDRGLALFDSSGKPTRVLGLVSDVTELKLAEQERQSLAERLEEAREDERRRLSRLLHDDIGQQLAAVSIKLHRLERKITEIIPDEQSVISSLVVVEELLHQNQRSIRNIAHILHPSVLEHFGLPEAVRRFVESVAEGSNRSGLPQIKVVVEQGFTRLSLEVETMIYRIIQEAVTNALKHADARSITIGLSKLPDCVVARVTDDGLGFQPESTRSTGIGLVGMNDRAQAFGSTLEISSTPGKGTTVELRVPAETADGPENVEKIRQAPKTALAAEGSDRYTK